MPQDSLQLLEVSRALPHREALAERLAPGRLVELSGRGNCARTSTAVSLLLHAQREGETTAWIQPRGGELFPPDLAACGIDLDALVVVHVPAEAGRHAPCRAAEILLRSGAFGLVVLDLSLGTPPGADAWQGRLLGLARQHQCRLLLLTRARGGEASLGPLIGVRVEPRRIRDERSDEAPRPALYRIEHEILKNKSGAPFEVAPELRLGPWGLL